MNTIEIAVQLIFVEIRCHIQLVDITNFQYIVTSEEGISMG